MEGAIGDTGFLNRSPEMMGRELVFQIGCDAGIGWTGQQKGI
jgi:hypothetical protein